VVLPLWVVENRPSPTSNYATQYQMMVILMSTNFLLHKLILISIFDVQKICCKFAIKNSKTCRLYYVNKKRNTKYNKMSSFLSLTQLETLQRVTDVVTEFVQNVPLLPAHRLEVVCATHQLRCQQHCSMPCQTSKRRCFSWSTSWTRDW